MQELDEAPFLRHSDMMRSAVTIPSDAMPVWRQARVIMFANQIQCPNLVCVCYNAAMRR